MPNGKNDHNDQPPKNTPKKVSEETQDYLDDLKFLGIHDSSTNNYPKVPSKQQNESEDDENDL